MTYIDFTNVEALKAFEYGLTISCPLNGDANPSYCHLHDIRLLSVEERFKWVDALSDEETVECYTSHLNCFTERVAQEWGQSKVPE